LLKKFDGSLKMAETVGLAVSAGSAAMFLAVFLIVVRLAPTLYLSDAQANSDANLFDRHPHRQEVI